MQPTMQQPPTREQMVAHFEALLKNRRIQLSFLERQRKVCQMKFDLAQTAWREEYGWRVEAKLATQEEMETVNAKRASLTFDIACLEYEISMGHTDMGIAAAQVEIEQIEAALKNATNPLVRPADFGVRM